VRTQRWLPATIRTLPPDEMSRERGYRARLSAMALQARSRDECGLRSSTRPNQVPGRGGTQRGRKSGCGASVSKMQVCTCLYTFHHRPSTLQIHMTVIPNINHRRKLATSQHLIPHTPKPTTTNDPHPPISSSAPPPAPMRPPLPRPPLLDATRTRQSRTLRPPRMSEMRDQRRQVRVAGHALQLRRMDRSRYQSGEGEG